MLFGAYAGFATAYGTNSLWLGFLAGAAAGLVMAMLMALFCVRLGLNQIVIGIALTLGADGITALLHHVQFSRTYPRLPRVETLDIPGLSEIPIIRAQPLLPAPDGLHRGHSGRGARPAFPQHQRGGSTSRPPATSPTRSTRPALA